MSIAEAFLEQLDYEAVSTRKLLERIPTELLTWKPHEKSFSCGQLASHIVNLLAWIGPTLETLALDLAADHKPWEATSGEDLVKEFDKNLSRAQAKLQGYPDSKMAEMWSLTGGGQTFFTVPRVHVVRSVIISHLIHHRGQLSVYLRLNDIPLPSIYGPSADESQ